MALTICSPIEFNGDLSITGEEENHSPKTLSEGGGVLIEVPTYRPTMEIMHYFPIVLENKQQVWLRNLLQGIMVHG